MPKTDNNSGVLPAPTGIPLLVRAITYEIYGQPERLKTTIDLFLFEIWESLLSDDEREGWSPPLVMPHTAA